VIWRVRAGVRTTAPLGLHDLFLGSTADRVVEKADCAVLVAG